MHRSAEQTSGGQAIPVAQRLVRPRAEFSVEKPAGNSPSAAVVLPEDLPEHRTCTLTYGVQDGSVLSQVLHFKRRGLPSFTVDPLALAVGEDVVGVALAWSERQLDPGLVLIYATAESAAVKEVQVRLGAARAGEMVEQALPRITRGLVERGVRQLVVAGGETSGAVVSELGVEQMLIGPQIDPGVPWTVAQSPVIGNGDDPYRVEVRKLRHQRLLHQAFERLEEA